MQGVERANAELRAVPACHSPGPLVSCHRHTLQGKEPGLDVFMDHRLGSMNGGRVRFLAEEAQLQSVRQLELPEGSEEDHRIQPPHNMRGPGRMCVRAVEGNQKARIRVNVQYRPRCSATNSAPLTLRTCSP